MVKFNDKKNKIFYGTLRYTNKKIYIGEYISSKNKFEEKRFIFHGKGVLNVNGYKIKGNWVNGKILSST